MTKDVDLEEKVAPDKIKKDAEKMVKGFIY